MIGAGEYLVSYGTSGEFARFRSTAQAKFQRGDRVVVRTHQGLELGVVMCPAKPAHAPFLSRTALGELLRPVTELDENQADQARKFGQRVFDDAQRLARELELPVEVLDIEILLDGQQAIVHHLRQADCDYRDLVSALSRKHDLHICMNNLALPKEEIVGCGEPNCGQLTGGCQSCGSGGCNTCGKGVKKEEVAAHLLHLRQVMEQRNRTPLL